MKQLLFGPVKFFCDKNDKDQTSIIESVICTNMKALNGRNIITAAKLDRLRPLSSTTPRMYSLHKIQKPSVPMRPIFSMLNSH